MDPKFIMCHLSKSLHVEDRFKHGPPESFLPMLDGVLIGFILHRSYANNHGCCKFASATALSCPFFFCPSVPSVLPSFPFLSFFLSSCHPSFPYTWDMIFAPIKFGSFPLKNSLSVRLLLTFYSYGKKKIVLFCFVFASFLRHPLASHSWNVSSTFQSTPSSWQWGTHRRTITGEVFKTQSPPTQAPNSSRG